MIITSSARFLLVTHLSGSPLQPDTHLRERLNSILDHELKADCQLLFCNVEQTELGWLIQSGQTYRELDARLSRLALPDSPALCTTGWRMERFELFEQYDQRGLGPAWLWCGSLVEKMYLRWLARIYPVSGKPDDGKLTLR
ncbi:hypothetical protein PUP68_15350 [Pseudomonas chlororaphis]|uniref:hypothetical protein n=1 Tax=Pseudomonas chlororaphis TaxID=587753 RepID=UPI0006A5FACA|nr:hypothetical protein [Pseudomonas chlororaphis]AZC30803.1 hypothetical protein C4K38_2843 [Pseudomonas chlororaphis subsp. piscium]WDG78513.1 hypothetical protein PUP77_29510 [Pseudomonas chlororaphis]WDG88436.1 hypothetical protein PUP68_15350 [Pseudomonas chlororaphis]WDG94692.1 hypothetical protein PUP49_15065 [Pseudomonas chlororaphis]SDT08734.1 hypothetical protein SAMN05216585_4534 [Pseudomonas chlororaphis]